MAILSINFTKITDNNFSWGHYQLLTKINKYIYPPLDRGLTNFKIFVCSLGVEQGGRLSLQKIKTYKEVFILITNKILIDVYFGLFLLVFKGEAYYFSVEFIGVKHDLVPDKLSLLLVGGVQRKPHDVKIHVF